MTISHWEVAILIHFFVSGRPLSLWSGAARVSLRSHSGRAAAIAPAGRLSVLTRNTWSSGSASTACHWW